MVARNMKELEAMLIKEMGKSMHISSERMLEDMYEETGKFYTTRNPVEYQRTGALADTPKTTPLSTAGTSVSYDAYLDTTHNYTTGKSPNMKDVLELASNGNTSSSVGYLRPTVGKLTPWEDIENILEQTLDKTLGMFFEKI